MLEWKTGRNGYMEKSLFNMLKEYGESDYYPFHMPGHKRSVIDGPLDNM